MALPRDTERMKGRPLAGEEFERMLTRARTGNYGQGIDELLECLWWSGLRLSEAMSLSWDEPECLVVLSIDGRRPLVEIPASLNKSRKPQLLAIVPEAALWLRGLSRERSGRVLQLTSKHGNPITSADAAGRIVSEIGLAAGVMTTDGHATAHDLRRSFALRWSKRVKPLVLKELMRHRDIKTTLTYYVGEEAERTADELWSAVAAADRISKPGRRSSTVAVEAGDLVTTNQG